MATGDVALTAAITQVEYDLTTSTPSGTVDGKGFVCRLSPNGTVEDGNSVVWNVTGVTVSGTANVNGPFTLDPAKSYVLTIKEA